MSSFSADELALLRRAFLDEARDHLEAIEAAARTLRGGGLDGAPVRALLSALHTLKGAAATVELDALAATLHGLEEELGPLRVGRRAPSVTEMDRLDAGLASVARAVESLRTQLEAPVAAMQQRGPDRRQVDRRGGASPVVRVELEHLDALADAAGALVVDRSRLARRLQDLAALVYELDGLDERARATLTRLHAGLAGDLDGLRATAQALQSGLRRVRFVRAARLFERVRVALGDIARRAGKQVLLETAGEDAGIDKAVVERIADPLLHLVRNAVAHGIEPVEARRARGKPDAGRVTLTARQRPGELVLVVADDGAGIDAARAREALVLAGRFTADEADALDEDALAAALFAGGVSTRSDADALAGRGVGVDTVREAVARLGGELVVSARAGEGTRVELRLPVRAAVEEALLFKVGGPVYAVPSALVRAVAPITPRDVSTVDGRDFVDVRGESLPVVRLGALFGAPAPTATDRRAAVVVADESGRRFAVTCDKVVGTREIVVRSLGPLLAPLRLYAGATVNGTGKVQLILDVPTLARMAFDGARLPARPRAARLRILIVDDARTGREAASRLLAATGYHIDTAGDGLDALALVDKDRFDLVLTDVEMPRMNGWDLVARLRERRDLVGTAVLVMSAHGGDDRREHARALGADGFLDKPLRRRDLLDAVATALRGRAVTATSGG